MPQVVAAWAVTAIGATGVAATFVYGFVYAATTIGIQAGLSSLQRSLAGKPKSAPYTNDVAAREITQRGTVTFRNIIYGQTRAAGVVVFFGTSGTGNQDLWFVVAYATHQCEALTTFTLDASTIPDGYIDGSTGAVTYGDFSGYLNIWKSLGAHNVTANSELLAAFPDLGSNFKGVGVAHAIFKMRRNETAYPNGAPQNFFSVVKGKRVYRADKDSTNGGSGSHRTNDATTWEWTDNWADCNRDYLTSGSVYFSTATPLRLLGVKVADSKIDDSYTITAHNTSDEDITIPPASPATQQKRYTCNVVLSCGNTHQENIDTLLSAGAGHWGFTNGKYRLYAGEYLTPSITLTDDDVLGKVAVQTHPKGDDHYNIITGTFYDEDRNWQRLNFPTVTSTAYQSDDGKALPPRAIELHATRTSYRCQRIAIIHLKQSRQFCTVEFEMLSPKASLIAEWETFMVTLTERGWSSKVFRCISKTYLANGFIAMTAREESAVAYDDPSVSDYLEPDEANSGILQLEAPTPPTNFVANSAFNGISFSWSLPTLFSTRSIVELWEYTSSTPFSSATKIWEGNASAKWITKDDTTQRYYWLRLRLGDGSLSSTEPSGAGVAGKASAVPLTLTANVSPSSLSLDTTTSSSGTTGSATVSVSGGTGPYTYAWTWASGGTSITTTSPTSNATTFSVTGMSSGETRSGVARCTVTDSVAATATVDIPVTIVRSNQIVMTAGGASGNYDDGYGGYYYASALGYTLLQFGSLSTASLNGKTLIVAYDHQDDSTAANEFQIQVTGFSSDPGATWFTSVAVGSLATLTTASATYSYSSGTASWTWSGQIGISYGATYTMVFL